MFWGLLSFVALFALLEVFGGIKHKHAKRIFVFFSVIFYLLSFLRWEFGTDWYGYTRLFDTITWSDTENHELLFSAVLIFTHNVFGHYTYALFFLASFLFYFQTKAILKLSEMPLITLFVLTGTYLSNVGFVRQQVAMAILLFSIVYIIKRKFIPFLLLVLIASGFHYSALVFLLAWWIFNINVSRKIIILSVIISVLSYVVVAPILVQFGQIVGGDIGMRIGGYTELGMDYEDTSALSYSQLILKSLFNKGLFFLIGFFLYYKPMFHYSFFRGFFNLYCFGAVLFFLTSPISIVFTRMSWYFDFCQILLVPFLFKYIKDKGIRIVLFLILSIILGAKLYLTMNAYQENYYKYKLTPLVTNLF